LTYVAVWVGFPPYEHFSQSGDGDQRLAELGTDFPTFIKDHQGLSLDEIWRQLTDTTGVPFSTRTLYRWVNDLEVAS
jgi:hypothetical protein